MTPILELIRLAETDQGTLGALKIQKVPFCCTLELPDLLNAPNRSSIPAQQYICQRIQSPKFGETFQVMNVPGRSAVLFHAGNTAADTEGCILLGQHWGKLGEQWAVLNSGNTFKAFLQELWGFNQAHLTIKEEY